MQQGVELIIYSWQFSGEYKVNSKKTLSPECKNSFEDTKGGNQKSLIEGHTNTMIRIKRTKESTNNDLQNTTQKIKDRATRTSLKQGDELRYCEREAPPVAPVLLLILWMKIINTKHIWGLSWNRLCYNCNNSFIIKEMKMKWKIAVFLWTAWLRY